MTRRAEAHGDGDRLARVWAHVFALAGLSVAQPLLDAAASTPEYFVVRGGGAWAFLAVALLGPPLVAVGASALAGWLGGDGWRRRVDDVALGGFAALGALLVLRRAPWPGPWPALALAAAIGVGFVVLYRRRRGVRLFLDALALLVLAVPVVFLASPRVRPLLFAGAAEVPAAPEVRRPAPVVVVIFDELPTASLLGADGRIDAERFPGFARLADTATWYRRAHTPAYGTLSSVPVILSGLEPTTPVRLPTAADFPRSLFTLLASSHRTVAVEPLTRLRPRSGDDASEDAGIRPRALLAEMGVIYLHLVTPEAWVDRLPNITTRWDLFRRRQRRDAAKGTAEAAAAGDRGEEFRAFLDRLEAGDRPPLAVLHSLLPHHPWHYLPSGRRYDTGDELYIDGLEHEERGAMGSSWVRDPWAVLQAYRRHLLQLAFTDRLVGELLDRLEALGLFDDALVVITADHGIHFEPGAPARQPGPRTWTGVARVPLIVKLPGQTEGRVDDAVRRTTDLVPTIAEVLEVVPADEAGWPMDGASLLGPPPPGRGEPRHAEPERTLGDVWRAATGGDPFALGPASRELVGRALGSPASTDGATPRAVLDRLGRVLEVVPGSDLLPARVTGRLAEPARPGTGLALALDGVVAATTRVRADGTRFAFLLPEPVLTPGVHELALARIVPGAGESGDGVGLAPVELDAPPVYHLDGDRLAGPSGPIDLDPAHADGEVVVLSFEGLGPRLEAFGWAEDAAGAPAASILAFVDGRLAGVVRPDLAGTPFAVRYALGEHLDAGFRLFLAPPSPSPQLRFVALTPAGAAELPHRRRHLAAADANGPFGL